MGDLNLTQQLNTTIQKMILDLHFTYKLVIIIFMSGIYSIIWFHTRTLLKPDAVILFFHVFESTLVLAPPNLVCRNTFLGRGVIYHKPKCLW